MTELTGNTCLCSACGEIFKSVTGFDKHRVGQPAKRRCLTTQEMLQRGMTKDSGGKWITRKMPVKGSPAFLDATGGHQTGETPENGIT